MSEEITFQQQKQNIPAPNAYKMEDFLHKIKKSKFKDDK